MPSKHVKGTRHYLAVVVFTVLPIMVLSCGGCPTVIDPFRLTVLTADGRALNPSSGEVLPVPTRLRLSTNAEYDSTTPHFLACGFMRNTAREVRFLNGSVTIHTDTTAPFEIDWDLVPGADGLPASGTGEVILKAINDNGVSTEVLSIQTQVVNP